MGTPWVESLTSYLTRVASAHGVFPGVLINKMIAPLVPGYSPYKRKHDLFRIGGGRSMLFNGVGLPATSTVQVLETLTLRTDLRYLTFLPLAPVLPGKAKSVVRFTKAWCPGCYEEWYETAQMLYDPLLWALQAISICPRHLCRLSTRCPYQECARPLPGVAWRSRVGYCSYCQRWLGVVPQRAKEQSPSHQDAEWQWQQWVADA